MRQFLAEVAEAATVIAAFMVLGAIAYAVLS